MKRSKKSRKKQTAAKPAPQSKISLASPASAPFPVVAIGASAGGLLAVIVFLGIQRAGFVIALVVGAFFFAIGLDRPVAAIKPAESGDANSLVVRLVENHGHAGSCRIDWALPVSSVRPVDLLERPLHLSISHNPESRSTSFDIKPFQIVTLALTLTS